MHVHTNKWTDMKYALTCTQCKCFKGLNIIIISAETQMEERSSRYDKWIRWAMCNNRKWCGLWWTKGIGDTGFQQLIFCKIRGLVLWEIFSLRKSEICIFMCNFQILLWKDITVRLTGLQAGFSLWASSLQPWLKKRNTFLWRQRKETEGEPGHDVFTFYHKCK